MNNASLEHVETAINNHLPKEFKKFILMNSGRWMQKRNFIRKVDDSFSQGMTLENVLTPSGIINGWKNMNDEIEFSKARLLPFAETLGSPVICIGYANENYSKIFVFDFDFYETKLSNSITEFIAMLE